jgi:hypothetical protein
MSLGRYVMRTRLKKSDIFIVIAVNSIIGTIMWSNYYNDRFKQKEIESITTKEAVNSETDRKNE